MVSGPVREPSAPAVLHGHGAVYHQRQPLARVRYALQQQGAPDAPVVVGTLALLEGRLALDTLFAKLTLYPDQGVGRLDFYVTGFAQLVEIRATGTGDTPVWDSTP